MPGALEVLRALGDLHVQARTVQSALQHCLGVPFVAPSRLQRRGGGDRKQALQSALGLDGSSVQAEALSGLAKPVTNEAHVFLQHP